MIQIPVTHISPLSEHFTFRDGRITEPLLVFEHLSSMPPAANEG